MGITIRGQVSKIGSSFDETIDYLNGIGVATGRQTTSVDLIIELREKPTIIRVFEELDTVWQSWGIIKLSKAGISLYVAHGTGDGTIFIPFENIIAIHTIDEDFLEKYATPPEVRAAQLRSGILESTENEPAKLAAEFSPG